MPPPSVINGAAAGQVTAAGWTGQCGVALNRRARGAAVGGGQANAACPVGNRNTGAAQVGCSVTSAIANQQLTVGRRYGGAGAALGGRQRRGQAGQAGDIAVGATRGCPKVSASRACRRGAGATIGNWHNAHRAQNAAGGVGNNASRGQAVSVMLVAVKAPVLAVPVVVMLPAVNAPATLSVPPMTPLPVMLKSAVCGAVVFWMYWLPMLAVVVQAVAVPNERLRHAGRHRLAVHGKTVAAHVANIDQSTRRSRSWRWQGQRQAGGRGGDVKSSGRVHRGGSRADVAAGSHTDWLSRQRRARGIGKVCIR